MVRQVRILIAGLIGLAYSVQSAQAGRCIETFYGQTVVKADAWYAHLTNGMVLRFLGQDVVDPRDWSHGDETGVCRADDDPTIFSITDLVLRQTILGYFPSGPDGLTMSESPPGWPTE